MISWTAKKSLSRWLWADFFSPFHSKQSSLSGKTIFKRIAEPNRAPTKWTWYRSGAPPPGGLPSGTGIIFCSIVHKWVPRLWEDRYWGSNWYCEQDLWGSRAQKPFCVLHLLITGNSQEIVVQSQDKILVPPQEIYITISFSCFADTETSPDGRS